MKKIALIDCNNFFVSCEILFKPELMGKPVCVLSNNEGCVISRSNEAKKMGVKMGVPYFIAQKKYKDVIFLKGNLPLYNEISSRIMKKLADFSPKIEIYSIDEAFLELEECDYKKIKDEIKNDVGIDVSIGVSTTKTLAKIASDKAKKCGRVYVIDDIKNELLNIKIEEIWGVGYSSAKLLRKYFIKNAYEFTQQNDSLIKRTMGKNGLDLKQELLGHRIHPVISGFVQPKSIQKTSSFKEFSQDKDFIKNQLIYHCHRICTKLRRLNIEGQNLTVILKTKGFEIIEEKIKLDRATNSEFEINKVILEVFERIYNPCIIYRAAGIVVSKLTNTQQLSLFDDNKAKNLPEVWDKIEEKFGSGKLHLGKNGIKHLK